MRSTNKNSGILDFGSEGWPVNNHFSRSMQVAEKLSIHLFFFFYRILRSPLKLNGQFQSMVSPMGQLHNEHHEM